MIDRTMGFDVDQPSPFPWAFSSLRRCAGSIHPSTVEPHNWRSWALALVFATACSSPANPEPAPVDQLKAAALVDRVHVQETKIATPKLAIQDTATTETLPPPNLAWTPKSLGRDLKLVRMTLTKGVAEREPLPFHDDFTVDERAMVFFEFNNLSAATRTFKVIWKAPVPHPPHDPIEVRVPPGERHRTWAYSLPLSHAGTWNCELRSEKGQVLATLPVVVNPRVPMQSTSNPTSNN